MTVSETGMDAERHCEDKMQKTDLCVHCGKPYKRYFNPTPTTDIIIHDPMLGVVVIERANEPHGFALPGGYIDEGEQAECAAVREAHEEAGLLVELVGLLGVYSRPERDPRQHNMSVVFVARAPNPGALKAGDDAARAAFYQLDDLPSPIVFDHRQILADFGKVLANERNLAPIEPFPGQS